MCFPNINFPVPPATVSLQPHGRNLSPSAKKRLPKADSATHREGFPFLNRNETRIHLFTYDYTSVEKKVKPGVVIRRTFPESSFPKEVQHPFFGKKLRRGKFPAAQFVGRVVQKSINNEALPPFA